jgi:hypothetical protein
MSTEHIFFRSAYSEILSRQFINIAGGYFLECPFESQSKKVSLNEIEERKAC